MAVSSVEPEPWLKVLFAQENLFLRTLNNMEKKEIERLRKCNSFKGNSMVLRILDELDSAQDRYSKLESVLGEVIRLLDERKKCGDSQPMYHKGFRDAISETLAFLKAEKYFLCKSR